jgi:cysteine desulfurase
LPVYLDNHSTTPVDPRVREAMRPYFEADFGNAASRTHAYGWRAEAAVEKARAQVAALIGASDKEIVFTSGATEADNLAIKGAAEAYAWRGDHLVTVKTEHKAVLDPCKRLERQRADQLDQLRRVRLAQLLGREVALDEVPELSRAHSLEADPELKRLAAYVTAGARVTYLGVRPDGRVDLDELRGALTDQTVLVSIMLANNEIGVLQPVEEIGRICRGRGALFHCDAVQGIGKVPFDVEAAQIDLASLSAHKLNGPKGIGALYVRRKPRVRVMGMIDGGGHERGMRSGTLDVPGIVGFGEACQIAGRELQAEAARVLALRERLRRRLSEGLPGVSVNGSLEHRLPGNLNVSFAGVDSDGLMAAVREVAVSSGSACMSATLEPSYVLRALGVPSELANGSIRFGLGRFTTEEEVDFAADRFVAEVRRLRQMHAAPAGAPAP